MYHDIAAHCGCACIGLCSHLSAGAGGRVGGSRRVWCTAGAGRERRVRSWRRCAGHLHTAGIAGCRKTALPTRAITECCFDS